MHDVGVDTDLLQTTLTDLGDQPDATDVRLILVNTFEQSGTSSRQLAGHSEKILTSDESELRFIVMPLAKESDDGSRIVRSTKELNGILLHELQHVVDFENPSIGKQDRNELKRFRAR